MNALLLVVLLSASPLQWDGSLWQEMDPASQVAYVAGFEGGLAVAAFLEKKPSLVMRIPPDYIITELAIFYADPRNLTITVPTAILYLGKRRPSR